MINHEKKVTLSVAVLTYNHEKYIKDCLVGVFSQVTNFGMELIIADDFSTDRNREEIDSFLKSGSNNSIIEVKKIFNDKNIGAINNFLQLLQACNGEYIAIIEGDDYWTDNNKLQKQVDFLRTNLEYNLTFHNALVKYDNHRKQTEVFNKNLNQDTFDLIDVIKKPWFVPTASIVLRKNQIDFPPWFYYVSQGDLSLVLILAKSAKLYYFDEVMSVYRKNSGNMGTTNSISDVEFKKLEILNYFDYYSGYQYHNLLEIRKSQIKSTIRYKFLKESGTYKKYLNLDYYVIKLNNFLFSKRSKQS